MKKLQQLSMAVMLTLMLATCAFAGIMDTPAPPPEPPPAAAPDSATATEIMGTPSDQQNSVAPSDSVLDAALSLLQSVLLVF